MNDLLVAVATYEAPRFRSAHGDMVVPGSKPQFSAAYNQAQAVVQRDVRVVRDSYASPLEIILGFTTAAGATIALGHQLVSLYERVQRARRTKAATDVSVAAYDILMASAKF